MKQIACRPMTGEFGLQYRRAVIAFNLLIDHDEFYQHNEGQAADERLVLQKMFEWEQGCLTSMVLIRQLRYEVALRRQQAAGRIHLELGELCQRMAGQIGQVAEVLTSLVRSGMILPPTHPDAHHTPRLDLIAASMTRHTELLESVCFLRLLPAMH